MRLCIAVAVALSPLSAWAEAPPLTKEDCRKHAPNVERIAESIRHLIETDKMNTALDYRGRARGPLLEASQAVIAANTKASAAQSDLVKALEDLAYQLRVCAR